MRSTRREVVDVAFQEALVILEQHAPALEGIGGQGQPGIPP
jgi:hypothetical protein